MTVGVLWVVYWDLVPLVAAVVGDGGGEQSCPWTAGRRLPVMVVLVMLTLRLIEMPGSWRCVV